MPSRNLPTCVRVICHWTCEGLACLQAEVDSFLEEAVVRRELSDNFTFYEPNYDKLEACSDWAKESLANH